MKKKLTIEEVKEWANKRYSKGHGFQTIVECWDDEDFDEYIEKSWSAGWEGIKQYVRTINSHYEEMQAEVF